MFAFHLISLRVIALLHRMLRQRRGCICLADRLLQYYPRQKYRANDYFVAAAKSLQRFEKNMEALLASRDKQERSESAMRRNT